MVSMAATATAPMTPEQFLDWEAKQELRHEYSPSGVRMMAGASASHVLITPNLSGLLFGALRGRPCRTLDSDAKLWVERDQAYYYPDAMVACPPNFINARQGIIDNPTVVFEVLSPGTQARDMGEKALAYQSLPSLREYVLVGSEAPFVTVYERDGESWTVRVAVGLQATLTLGSLGVEIALADLYEGVAFGTDDDG